MSSLVRRSGERYPPTDASTTQVMTPSAERGQLHNMPSVQDRLYRVGGEWFRPLGASYRRPSPFLAPVMVSLTESQRHMPHLVSVRPKMR